METTEPINITQYFSFINHTSSDIDDIRDYVHGREKKSIEQLTMESTLKFEIANHAFPRWNTRVGPVMNDVNVLASTIGLLYAQKRVKLYHKQCIGIIDDDILFTFEARGKTIIRITTFYGRISLVPFLEDFDMLRRYNRKSGDNIRLEQSTEVLNAQSLVVQKDVMHFEGNQQKYVLERFNARSGEIIYITITNGSRRGLVMEINPQVVDLSITLNRRCLGALREIGYDLFVEQFVGAIDEKKKQALGLGA